MTRRLLPIGLQDFRTMREQGFYYVGKTPLIRQLVGEGRCYFLSRPRRFGKSLLLDTLRSLFECREELFRDLDIHGHWDWSDTHPVLLLSFGGKYDDPGEIEGDVIEQLEAAERQHGLAPAPTSDTGPGVFGASSTAFTMPPGGRWWSWWMNTTSRSSTCCMTRSSQPPTGITCGASTGSSRTAQSMSASYSSPV